MTGKNRFKRVSTEDKKSAKQCVSGVNVKDCSQTLAVSCHLGFMRGVASRVGGGRRGQYWINPRLSEKAKGLSSFCWVVFNINHFSFLFCHVMIV